MLQLLYRLNYTTIAHIIAMTWVGNQLNTRNAKQIQYFTILYYVWIYGRDSMSILPIHIAVIKNVCSRKREVSLRIIMRARRVLVEELVREKENRTISMYLIVDNSCNIT